MSTFAEEVTAAVASMTPDAAGKLQLPEGLSEGVKYAANAERRVRDNQAAFSKSRAEVATLTAANAKLTEKWQADFVATIPETDELLTLKANDPDAWRAKINELEQARTTEFSEQTANINTEAKQVSELEARTATLATFLTDNPAITEDMIENDTPPRILKRLEKGEISFEGYLSEVATYLTAGKTLATSDAPADEPNLSNAGGSSIPTATAVDLDAAASYKNETY